MTVESRRRSDAMTISEAVEVMSPPIPRRELARRLAQVAPVGAVYGRRGRRAAAFPVGAILEAHAAWVRDRSAVGNGSTGMPESPPRGVRPYAAR